MNDRAAAIDCPHPNAVGKRYGDPLAPERQAELQAMLDAWNAPEADHDARIGPFAGARLTGADVYWLASQVRKENGTTPDLRLEGAILSSAHLERAALAEAHLEGVDFWQAHLERAYLNRASLESASLFETHLEGATLFRARLEGARLFQAHLEGADLVEAHLEGARLNQAHLEGADFTRAHLERRVYQPDDVDLSRVRRVDPDFPATLSPADLRNALLTSATTLRDATLCAPDAGDAPRVADTHWGGANLSTLDWTPFTKRGALLGDERAARDWRPTPFQELAALQQDQQQTRRAQSEARKAHKRRLRREALAIWADATRANRQVAMALRAQGMGDEADHFAYRAQLTRRALLRRRRAWGRWLVSGVLDLLAGYGYRARRSLVAYFITLAVFTGLYLLASVGLPALGLPGAAGRPLQWYDALALSVSSFHGRGFFQFPLTPGDPLAILGVSEAVIGLFIEIGVIAAFVQRSFGAR